MSVESLAVVLHHSRATTTDKLVLIGIANHDGDGGAWPSIETLARYAAVSERTVQRSLTRLLDLGEIAVHRQGGGPRDLADYRRPNRYDVLVSCPLACDRTPNHRIRDLGITQPDLGISGVTPMSPGDTHVTPPGDTHVTLTIPKNQPPTLVSQPQTARGGDTPPCARCGAANLTVCRERDAKVSPEDRHTYEPITRRSTA